MDLGISGRVAIVTGASAGIGYAVAEQLLVEGTSVVVVARDRDRLEASAASLRERTGGEVFAQPMDVSSPTAATEIMEGVMGRFGRLDILVNNAGRAHAGGLLDATEEDWEEMAALKLTSMRRMCRAAIPVLAKQRWGRIVNMSSIGGIYPNPKLLVSHVLSAAINNLTKGLALEVAPLGILVNAIGIGAVATDNWAANMIPSVRRRRPELKDAPDEEVLAVVGRESTPIGRPGLPEEIAAIAVFLASARNGFVTGDTIEASGGADRFM
ncbi:SDR family NAD(P)-dependent oxidoreductase [Cupriavidus sp. CuC1]|uniref:SDR family NAD(P)-dependent oxidoreductase n=1 Tax=Cupriavidus sp. CuC1 TaxID=3373131 RepID=UPI0037D21A91